MFKTPYAGQTPCPDQIESLISEYQSTVEHCSTHDHNNLARALAQDHEWSDEGARAIIDLANNYGSFMLKNALALSIALEKEDGDLGY